MSLTTIALICLLLHFVADFNLQGMLKDLKQKVWWEKNYPDKKYRYDYQTAGWIHAFMWSIFTFLPFVTHPYYEWIVMINAVIHYVIDNFKANELKLSLTQDQVLHLVQIWATVPVFVFCG